MRFEAIRRFISAHRLPMAIAGAIGIALLLTVISVSLYIRSGASRLDLSRPGYEKVRDKVKPSSEDDNFSASGPMNLEVANDFQKLYTKKRTTLSQLDPFDPAVLDDSSIRLITPGNPTGE